MVIFRNRFGIISQPCRGDVKRCSGQGNVVWQAKYFSRITESASLIYNTQGISDFRTNLLSNCNTLLKGAY